MPIVLQPLVKASAVDQQAVRRLARDLGLTLPAARVLFARGLVTPEQALEFINCPPGMLLPPELLLNLTVAAQAIRQAIMENKKIAVYGDYDVDGVCATVLLYRALSHLRAQVQYYLPDRHREGYGLNAQALTQLHEEGVKLVITVDCGINALKEAALAKELGLQLIVTDHHELPETLPNCLCVNPKMGDYPFGQLCGAGVALKLALSLTGELPEYFSLAALATVADIVPLTGENRYIVKKGLEGINTAPGEGLQSLLRAAGISRAVTAADLGFVLGPRLNAAGRLHSAGSAVELLLGENCEENAVTLNTWNLERQQAEAEIVAQAVEQAYATGQVRCRRVLFLADENWDKGVIGIAASRLAERFNRPCFLFSLEGDVATGSGRSVAGVHLYNALHQSGVLLTRYGGHEMAAGLTLPTASLEQLQNEMDAALQELPDKLFYPAARYDVKASLNEFTLQACMDLEKLAPFGAGNPQPRFRLDGTQVVNPRLIGKTGSHCKASIKDAYASLEGIAYQYSEQYMNLYQPEARFSFVASPQLSEWNSVQSTVLRLHAALQERSGEEFSRLLLREEQALCAGFYSQFNREDAPPEAIALEAEEFTGLLNETFSAGAGALVLCSHPDIAKNLGMLVAHSLPAADLCFGSPLDKHNGYHTFLVAPRLESINWRAYQQVLVADAAAGGLLWEVQALAPHAELYYYPCDAAELIAALPPAYNDFSRENLGAYYRALKKAVANRSAYESFADFAHQLQKQEPSCNAVMAQLAVTIFCQLQLFALTDGKGYTLTAPAEAKPVVLTDSPLYNILNRKTAQKGRQSV